MRWKVITFKCNFNLKGGHKNVKIKRENGSDEGKEYGKEAAE